MQVSTRRKGGQILPGRAARALVLGVLLPAMLWGVSARAQGFDLPEPGAGLREGKKDVDAFEERLLHKPKEGNLVMDASFESKLPLWLSRTSHTGTFVDKLPSPTAHDGRRVMTISGWAPGRAAEIVSPPIKIETRDISACMWVRVLQTNKREIFAPYRNDKLRPARLSLCLFRPDGKEIIRTLLDVEVDKLTDQWLLLKDEGIPIQPTDLGPAKLGLLISGAHDGRTIEVDQLGLFHGKKLPEKIVDNNETIVAEAEAFADGVVWKKTDHFRGWYYRLPSGGAMLSGAHRLKGERQAVSRTYKIATGGKFKLWVRHLTGPQPSFYYVSLFQKGKRVLYFKLDSKYVAAKATYMWRWDSAETELEPGEVRVEISRPAGGASWIARHLDLLILTNNIRYEPNPDCVDLLPRGYVRFTNTGEAETEPWCLHLWVRRHQGPNWYANPGILSMAGLSGHYYVPGSPTMRLLPGAKTPWCWLNRYFLEAGGRNNLSIQATRESHARGFVYGERIKGRIEFGVEKDGRIEVIRTVEVDQTAPRVVMTLPADFKAHPDRLLTGFDYIAQKQKVIDELGPAPGPRAKHLQLSAILQLKDGRDDPRLIEAELAVLKKLGFNSLYNMIGDPKDLDRLMEENDFKKAHGAGLGLYYKVEDPTRIGSAVRATVENSVKKARERLAPIVDNVTHSKQADEPGAIKFDTICNQIEYRERFVEYLRQRGLKLSDLALPLEKYDWKYVRPIMPEEKHQWPVLYYYTALWRLETFRDACKVGTDAGKLEFAMEEKKDEVEKALTEENLKGVKTHEPVELFGGSVRMLITGDGKGNYRLQTSAEYDTKYWKIIDEHAPEKPMRLKHLLMIDRFIGGDRCRQTWERGIRNLARLGCNAIQVPAGKRYRDILLSAGVKKTAFAVYNPPGYAFDYGGEQFTDPALREWAAKYAKPYYDSGYKKEEFAYFALSDEPGWYYPAMLEKWNESPERLARFHDYLRAQGLGPADVGADAWEQVMTVGRSQHETLEQRRLFYWSARFFPHESARHFARVTRALEEVFYPGLPISTNWNFFAGRYYNPGPIAHNKDKTSPDAAMGGHEWFDFGRQRGCTALWTEDWFGDGMAYQWSFYAAKLNWASQKGGVTWGGYVIGRTAGGRKGGMAQKVLSIFGNGGKVVKFYTFGPEYNFPGNCWSERRNVYPELLRALKIVAPAEDLLWPGRRPLASVAIVQPQSAQPWDLIDQRVASGIMDVTNVHQNAATVGYMAEAYNLYMALMHANIPTDFIDEKALVEKDLNDYRVVYITSPNVPIEAQRQLGEWVKAGGTLVTVSNAGSADRYNDATTVLEGVRGVAESPRERFYMGRIRKMPVKGRIKGAPGEAEALGVRAELKVAGATPLAQFADGTPAVTLNQVGKGRAVHYAFLPGLSYWWSRSGWTGGLPTGFSAVMRRYAVLPVRLADVKPALSCDVPLVETPILVSEKGAAISLLNWTGQVQKGLTLRVDEARLMAGRKVKRIESSIHGTTHFTRKEGQLVMSVDLDEADVIMLWSQ